jgi:hypothetical protein
LEIIKLMPTSLQDLIQKLQMIHSKVVEKVATGFDVETPYFHYVYHIGEETGRSKRSCDDCAPHAFEEVNGYEVRSKFPNTISEFPFVPAYDNSLYPNMHQDDASKTRYCGCELEMVAPADSCAASLVDEIKGEINV